MNLKDSNNTKIKAAFVKATANSEASIKRGLVGLLEWGVNMAFEEHGESRQNHLKMGDSYGYVLVHKGKEEARKVWANSSEVQGNANSALNFVKSKVSGAGWCGIILAGMKPARYFSLSTEMGVLRRTIQDFQYGGLRFDDYFKPMTV